MNGVNVPGVPCPVPGTRNSRNADQYRDVPGVPGVPGLPRTCAYTQLFFTRAHELFPVRVQEEHPEHPEQTRQHKAFRCSGYPEHEIRTRNRAHG
jgi:hypothetical protein